MHIIKNTSESFIGTILDLQGKSKDNFKCRHDLQEIEIRSELHIVNNGSKEVMLPTTYMVSAEDKRKILEILENIKVSDGFSSNIAYSINVKERKLIGLKSHDYYILLKYLFPIVIRGVLPNNVVEPVVEFAKFFSALCSKVLEKEFFLDLECRIATTLCKLEMIFSPSFFDIMIHFPIHLATEAKMAGLVQFRWMFPIEQEMSFFKNLIRNRAHPEGSIAEGYIANKCLLLCSRYLQGIKIKFNYLPRNYEDDGYNQRKQISIFNHSGRSL
ncbi:hypothetical protein AXF42_Ash007254 [Apostasia shenzhenica]|uniref:DUF4218 domain-containing protein n=1 Tax=Apostasia shenzhenica TaxID=1088818 RepID=A0A2I0B9Q6_9ASPA|nr:hypothetical protein AXF42_Ash007254 [Apostasia shenzhenica]